MADPTSGPHEDAESPAGSQEAQGLRRLAEIRESGNRAEMVRRSLREPELSAIDRERRADSRLRRHLRLALACWALLVLSGQMALLTWEFHRIGIGGARFDDYQFHAFLAATVLQAWGIVVILAKYVFKD